MKKLTLSLCAVVALASAASAGTETYSSKNVKQVAPAPCPTWYADNEWNIGVWGTYAPTVNSWREDTFLGVDHAWGGGIDVNYFFRRYFGVGISGFGLGMSQDDRGFNNRFVQDDSSWAGGVVGKFTLRYPIPCSRFAPYAFLGLGGVWGGQDYTFTRNGNTVFASSNDGGHFMAQYGAGFEVRFTPRIGMINDIVYNQLEGGENDFIMIRTGLNFAF
jgi:opacity protein-like surface antigen